MRASSQYPRCAFVLWLWLWLVLGACTDDTSHPHGDALDASHDASRLAIPNGYVPDADPEAPGPFLVGATRRTVPHTGIDGGARPLDTVIWYPAGAGGIEERDLGAHFDAPLALDGPFPLLAFSHGNNSEPNQSRYQVTHLASHGFVIVAPAHPGSRVSECGLSCSGTSTADSAANRPGEIVAAIDFVLAENAAAGTQLAGAVDDARLGVLGHSFGGYTAISLLGGESRARFRAGIGMAPAANPSAAPNIEAPFMLMAAELDTLVSIESTRGTYAALAQSRARHFLWFASAGHYAYNDACILGCTELSSLDQDLAHSLINTYGTAFLQVHVGGSDDRRGLLRPDANIANGEARLEVGTLSF